jgi:hypothetical protein
MPQVTSCSKRRSQPEALRVSPHDTEADVWVAHTALAGHRDRSGRPVCRSRPDRAARSPSARPASPRRRPRHREPKDIRRPRGLMSDRGPLPWRRCAFDAHRQSITSRWICAPLSHLETGYLFNRADSRVPDNHCQVRSASPTQTAVPRNSPSCRSQYASPQPSYSGCDQ